MTTAVKERTINTAMPTFEEFLAGQTAHVVVTVPLDAALRHYGRGNVPPEFVASCCEYQDSFALEYARVSICFDLWNGWLILDTEQDYNLEVRYRVQEFLPQLRDINRRMVLDFRLEYEVAQELWDKSLHDLLATEEEAAHDAVMDELEHQLENCPRGRRHARTHHTALH